MVFNGKAEVIELNGHILHTSATSYHCPSVIRLSHMVKRPKPHLRLSRREVFIRDKYTCQYCGIKTRDLTLDHVIPKSRGGLHTWDNLVSACKDCNHRKGGKSPEEARMKLLSSPHEPKISSYYIFLRKLESSPNDGWEKFIPAAAYK